MEDQHLANFDCRLGTFATLEEAMPWHHKHIASMLANLVWSLNVIQSQVYEYIYEYITSTYFLFGKNSMGQAKAQETPVD